jgi:beta-glucosidase
METVKAFAEYAGYMAERLSDRVKYFFAINEFRSFVDAGYRGTEAQVGGGKSFHLGAPPELELPIPEFNQVRHHTVLAHGLAVQAVRARGAAGTKVGPAENIALAVPAMDTPEHVRAAEIATRELNAPFLTVMLEGRYTDAYLADADADAPVITDEELGVIASPVDFIGIRRNGSKLKSPVWL